MTDIQPGPCAICGLRNYSLSFGGPTICPGCDSGDSGPSRMNAQRERIAELERSLSETTRLADEKIARIVQHDNEAFDRHHARYDAQVKYAEGLRAALEKIAKDLSSTYLREWSQGGNGNGNLGCNLCGAGWPGKDEAHEDDCPLGIAVAALKATPSQDTPVCRKPPCKLPETCGPVWKRCGLASATGADLGIAPDVHGQRVAPKPLPGALRPECFFEVGYQYLVSGQWRNEQYWNGCHATASRVIYAAITPEVLDPNPSQEPR